MVQLSYRRIKSGFHRIQKFVNYIMLEVVLRSPKMKEDDFNLEMVRVDRYRKLIENVDSEYLLTPLSVMYKEFHKLEPWQLRLFRKAVYCNNKIKDLCEKKQTPVHYSELANAVGEEHSALIVAIRQFSYSLYDKCVRRAPFYHEFGKIDDYYNRLVNRNATCVMCGVPKRILSCLDDKMSAFDHYLPRDLYPFNSVNTENLVPTCDICNSKNKGAIDPLYEKKGCYGKVNQLKSFYPFSNIRYDIDINIRLMSQYHKDMLPEDVIVTLTCKGVQNEVTNWDRIYHIKKRYAKACCEDDFYEAYKMAFVDCRNHGLTTNQYIMLLEGNKTGDMNFLKIPFLKAIQNLGQ
mgnify:CR=1 FL=1